MPRRCTVKMVFFFAEVLTFFPGDQASKDGRIEKIRNSFSISPFVSVSCLALQ